MKTISIKSNGLGRYDDVSPFIMSEGKLEIQFILPTCNGQFFFIGENNETKIKKFIPEKGKITILDLMAGELKGEVKHYIRGELIESYKIEPLLLKNVNSVLSGTPELEKLNRENEELKKSLNEAIACVEKLNARFAALLKFAYADYKSNIYLSGGSLDDFLNEFKIELSEEERQEIFSKE